MPDLIFSLSHWAAWAPGICSHAQWANWTTEQAIADSTPDISWLPAMQRRRLSVLGRSVFHVVNEVTQKSTVSDVPTVMASRHGEIARTQSLLENLADQAPLSPATFSLSVHNAIGGQLSIALGNRQPMSCIALGEEGLGSAILESICLQQESSPVLLVAYDGPVPDCYSTYCDPEPFTWAIALLLGGGGPHWRLRRGPGAPGTTLQGPRLARALACGETHIPLPGEHQGWLLEKA